MGMNIPKNAIEKAIEGGWEPFKTVPIAEIDWNIVGSTTLHGNIRPTNQVHFHAAFAHGIYPKSHSTPRSGSV